MSKESSRQPVHFEIKRKGPVADLFLPCGNIRIIYGNHLKRTDPQNIPKNTDGIFLEGGPDLVTDDFRQYSLIKEFATSKQTPLFSHDLSLNILEAMSFYFGMVGTALASYYMPHILLSNSSFGEGVKDIPAFYHIGPRALVFIMGISSRSSRVGQSILSVTDKIMPYRAPITLRLRNAIWASKLHWALKNGLGAHFTTIVGAEHFGLENYLKREAAGLESGFLEKVGPMYKYIGDAESYYQISQYNPTPAGKFTHAATFEVPKLRKLVQPY